MNAPILNRDFQHPADGWYQIEPLGNHPNREAGIIQVIDDEASRLIVNRFNTDADAGQLSHGAEMLIDHEHFKHDLDKETIAYGWLNRLEARPDGIYGRVRWSNTGKKAVDGGDYRFFSTEYDPADIKVLNAAGKSKRVRPLRLDGLTLTNSPNNKGGKPITNRGNEFRRGLEPSAGRETKTAKKNMNRIATMLELSAEASEDSILAAVTKLLNRATDAESKLKPMTERVTALESQNTVLLDEQIAADLATHGIKDEKIVNRLKPVLTAMKNREERTAFLTDCVKAPGKDEKKNEQRKLLNRQGKGPESAGSAVDDACDEAGRVARAESEIQSFKITNRCTYSQARDHVRRTKPELFTPSVASN